MRYRLLMIVSVAFLFCATAAFADDFDHSAQRSRSAPHAFAQRPTLSDAVERRGKELQQLWLKSPLRRSGGEGACDFSCTNDCYWGWFGCWYNNGQGGDCEDCCAQWRQCMTDNSCCTNPPQPDACPTGCPVP